MLLYGFEHIARYVQSPMTFRYARHTNDLHALIEFYTGLMGFDVLGSFENHSNYDGVFVGRPGQDWHLEFTTGNAIAHHQPDEDDLLVFYFDSKAAINAVHNRALSNNVPIVQSQNPYWRQHGIELRDPDGFGVILTIKKD